NDDLRKYVINANKNDLDHFANNLQATVKSSFFDGVDLDIEAWWIHSKEENLKFATNLAYLVTQLRNALNADPATNNKPIMIAVGIDAAGVVPGGIIPSNPDYAGTMKPFFQDS